MSGRLLRSIELPTPGDILLVGAADPIDRLLQFCTHGPWNHAALVVSESGAIVEMVDGGIRLSNLIHYPEPERALIRIDRLSHEDRRQVCAYAYDMLRWHERYGYLGLLNVALRVLTRSRLVLKWDGSMICSEFVAAALAEGGEIFDEDTALITPADLYRHFLREDAAEEPLHAG